MSIPIQGTLFGNAYGAPLCDLKNVPVVTWDGSIPFAVIYANYNIATLDNMVTITLKGTGHTITNQGSAWTNMKYVAFQSPDTVRTINIAQNATMDNVPTLTNGVILRSQSTVTVCSNPANPINIGYNCTLSCDPGVSNSHFVFLSTTHTVVCFLNSGTISGDHVFLLNGTSTLIMAAINVSLIDGNSVYGTSGMHFNLNYDADSIIPSFPHFTGTFNDLTMSISSQVQGAPLQLANLTALNNFVFTSQLIVGQWGYAQDTDKVYILTSKSPITWTEYTPAVGSVAFSAITGDPYDNTPLAADLNSINESIGESNPESSNFYFENIIIQGTNANNDIPLKVLDLVPSGAIEYDANIVVNSSTEPVLHSAFIYPDPMDYMSGFLAGQYGAKTWASVDTLGYTTQLLFNGMNWHTYPGLTVTTTGTGTTRTATVTPISTVFTAGDANSDPTLASFLETPQGRYQIVGFSAFYVVTIKVPATYTNETNVAVSKYTIISHWSTPNIVGTDLREYTSFSRPYIEQSPSEGNWSWGDKFAMFVWGITTNPTDVTITFAYNGWTRCSKIESPKELLVDSREIEADHDSIVLNYNTLNPLYLSPTPINWSIPWEAKYILDAQIVYFANGASVTTDIDVLTNYTNDPNASISQYSASDTTTLYDVLGPNLVDTLSFLPLITSAERGTVGTVVMTRQDMTPAIYITKIRIYYYY
jgi:hypothetical protein